MERIAQLGWLIAQAALAVALFTLPIAFSVRYAATSESWWERGFSRYDAPRRTGLAAEEVSRIGAETRAYLTNDEERLSVELDGEPFFSEREVLHMVDVKVLMARTFDAGWAALGYIIAFAAAVIWRRRKESGRFLAKSVLNACGLVTAVVVVLAIIAVIGFDDAFRRFHLLFFTNDLWQLSSRDRLIQLFPQGFFFETTLLIGGSALALMVLAGASAVVYSRWFDPATTNQEPDSESGAR